MSDIAHRRLRAQRLSGEPFASPVAAIRWLGAVQSQDYGGAKWALGQRTRNATEAELDRLFDEGAILRTHVLRPTWHFVTPADIRWLLELTGPRVKTKLAGRLRQLEIDDAVVDRASAAFTAALTGGHHLTRPELAAVLGNAGIAAGGQRLPHLIMRAELDGLIISGPRRGKQFTYALLEERVPKAPPLEPDEALGELARRYFQSHGPAQIPDFVWWSGLTVAAARTALALAGSSLEHEAREGRDYWFDAGAGPLHESAMAGHLLPNFDEYTVAYRDRSAVVDPQAPLDAALFSFGSILSNIVTVEGRVRGAWRRTSTRAGLQVEINLLTPLGPAEISALEQAGRRLSRFIGRPVHLHGLGTRA